MPFGLLPPRLPCRFRLSQIFSLSCFLRHASPLPPFPSSAFFLPPPFSFSPLLQLLDPLPAGHTGTTPPPAGHSASSDRDSSLQCDGLADNPSNATTLRLLLTAPDALGPETAPSILYPTMIVILIWILALLLADKGGRPRNSCSGRHGSVQDERALPQQVQLTLSYPGHAVSYYL